MKRTFDVNAVNNLINSPDIRPTVGGDGYLSAAVLLSDTRNVCLLAEGGGAFFRWSGPRIFEGHSFLQARGRAAITLGRSMLAFMADHADLIWGLTPLNLRHVRWFNRQIGFHSLGSIETPDGTQELFEKRF